MTDEQFKDSFRSLASLIENVAESLGREVDQLRTATRQGFDRLDARLDATQTRMDVQGGKIRSGTVWMSRIDEWSDKVDHLIAERDRLLAQYQKDLTELRERITRLEKRQNGTA